MTKNTCPFKVGTCAVLLALNGDSHSVTISRADRKSVTVYWYSSPGQRHTTIVSRADWNLLTPFGEAKFLVI